jgi:hypothetical protein
VWNPLGNDMVGTEAVNRAVSPGLTATGMPFPAPGSLLIKYSAATIVCAFVKSAKQIAGSNKINRFIITFLVLIQQD